MRITAIEVNEDKKTDELSSSGGGIAIAAFSTEKKHYDMQQ